MSTRKEQRKDEETTATTTTTTSPSQVQQEQQQSVNRALDQAKDNIRKTVDEARNTISHYTQIVNDYQEQTIQAAWEIADNYLESQKEPQIEAVNRVFASNCIAPRHLVDNYARVVSSLADNTIAATRLVNNTIFANLEVVKTSVQNAKDNVKEFSRIGVNAAKTFEQSTRDTTTRFSY